MKWLKESAPIRRKMSIDAGFMTAMALLTALIVLGMAVADHPALAATTALVFAILTAAGGIWIREVICGPYVSTVMRMEELAAGDLAAPINHTHYKDCVGRMTKAMFTFRETAVMNIKQLEVQGQLVEVLGSHLDKLRNCDLTAPITAEFPPEYAAVKTNFNKAIDVARPDRRGVRECGDDTDGGGRDRAGVGGSGAADGEQCRQPGGDVGGGTQLGQRSA